MTIEMKMLSNICLDTNSDLTISLILKDYSRNAKNASYRNKKQSKNKNDNPIGEYLGKNNTLRILPKMQKICLEKFQNQIREKFGKNNNSL